MKNIWIILFLIGCCAFSNAYGQQQDQVKLIQFSGIIHNADSNITVPYVTLTNLTYQNQLFNANHQGFFSFVAREGDTVRLSAIGYRSTELVIPKTSGQSVTVNISMKSQVVDLPVVTVFPWASIEEFNYAFMNLKIADDDYMIAQRNVTHESLMSMARVVPRNAAEIQNMSVNDRHIGLSNKVTNQRNSNALFSPLAWASFINQITQGNRSRSQDN